LENIKGVILDLIHKNMYYKINFSQFRRS